NLQIGNSTTFFDRIRVNGTVGLTGSILRLNSGGTTQFPAVNTTFVIVENDGTDPVQGLLSDEIPGQSPVIIGDETTFIDDLGRPWRIDYQGGDGNDVAITYLGIPPQFTNRQLVALGDSWGTARLTGFIVEPEPKDRFILEIDWNDGTARQKYNF